MHEAIDTISIVIAEDKDVMQLGLNQLLSANARFQVIGTARDTTQLARIVATNAPRVLIVRDQLPGEPLCDIVRQIRLLAPSVGILVLVSQPADFWQALECRADGYVLREVRADMLKQAVHQIASGHAFLGVAITDYLLHGDGLSLLQSVVPRLERSSALDSLSRREKEVIALLSEGHSNEQIAHALGLSIQTVKVHVKHILKKLKVSDRTQAVIKVLKRG